MGRWRIKVLYSLIMFGAGFAAAVYVLAPPPDEEEGSDGVPTSRQVAGTIATHAEQAVAGSQERAVQMRAGIDRAASFAEEYAVKAFRVARLQLDQWRQQHGQ